MLWPYTTRTPAIPGSQALFSGVASTTDPRALASSQSTAAAVSGLRKISGL